jgi:RND superfamily putative drug exporter
MAVTRLVVRWRYRRRHDPVDLRRRIAARAEPAPIPVEVRAASIVTEPRVGGRRLVRIEPRGAASGPHVVHLHGGAYVHAIQDAHWRLLSRLAADSGATIWVPLYGVAPASDVGDAIAFLDRVVASVRAAAPGCPLVVSGDSAGGGLALVQALRQRDPLAGVLLFSPWLDLTLPAREDPRLERRDPMLSMRSLATCAELWANGRPLDDPRVSPLFADLRGLPEVLTIAGGRDVLVDDARRLDAALRDAGVASRLEVWRSGFHLFVAATGTSESQHAMRLAADWLRDRGSAPA